MAQRQSAKYYIWRYQIIFHFQIIFIFHVVKLKVWDIVQLKFEVAISQLVPYAPTLFAHGKEEEGRQAEGLDRGHGETPVQSLCG